MKYLPSSGRLLSCFRCLLSDGRSLSRRGSDPVLTTVKRRIHLSGHSSYLFPSTKRNFKSVTALKIKVRTLFKSRSLSSGDGRGGLDHSCLNFQTPSSDLHFDRLSDLFTVSLHEPTSVVNSRRTPYSHLTDRSLIS